MVEKDAEWLKAMIDKGHTPLLDRDGNLETYNHPAARDEHPGPMCVVCEWSCCKFCEDLDEIPKCEHSGAQVDEVLHFSNGMTMVFDQHGQQITGLQGQTSSVLWRLRHAGWDDGRSQRVAWIGNRIVPTDEVSFSSLSWEDQKAVMAQVADAKAEGRAA